MDKIQKKKSLELELSYIWVDQTIPDESPVLYQRKGTEEVINTILEATDNAGHYSVELNHGVLKGRHEGRVKELVFATSTRIFGQCFDESFNFEEYLQFGKPKRVKVDLDLVYSRE